MVVRWCRRCGVGPPNFYNSRGLCNICHKTLRHVYVPLWDSAWKSAVWTGSPTGQAGVVANGPCQPRCGKLRSHACSCGGPGGGGLPLSTWRERLGQRTQELLLEGDLVPALDAWENIPPELTTYIGSLFSRPEVWLADQIGKPAVQALAEPARAVEAARVATSLLYRWWRTGPGVPGPGTAFVVQGGQVVCVHVDPKVVMPLELWGSSPRIEDIVWDQIAGSDPTPAPLDRTDTFVVTTSQQRVLRKHPVEVLTAHAATAGFVAEVLAMGQTWSLGMAVGDEWLEIHGELDAERVEVIWSHGHGVSVSSPRYASSPWPMFFAAVRNRYGA